MKNSYIVRAKKFINIIFPYIYSCRKNVVKVHRVIEKYNREHHRKILVNHGAVRIVLVTSDYVIKWDYDERNARLYGGCISEEKMYSFACNEGYEYLLAECTQVVKDGVIFNIMPRFNMREDKYKPDYASLVSDDEYDWLNDNISDLHTNNYTVVNGSIVVVNYACSK